MGGEEEADHFLQRKRGHRGKAGQDSRHGWQIWRHEDGWRRGCPQEKDSWRASHGLCLQTWRKGGKADWTIQGATGEVQQQGGWWGERRMVKKNGNDIGTSHKILTPAP